MPDKYVCPHCLKTLQPTMAFRFRKHNGAAGEDCIGSGEFVPAHQISMGPVPPGADPELPEEGRDVGTCPTCARRLALTPDGHFPPHPNMLRGKMMCPNGGAAYKQTTDLPDIQEFAKVVDSFQPPSQDDFFANVGKKAAAEPAYQVDDLRAMGDEIAARLKEIFYAYDNRKTSDNRSAQTTLGPSEIGTPCDRRLAMSLLSIPPVNPGGDGWAAFVGTCIHVGLAEMFMWADNGTGRFAVEQSLTFPNALVPHGTADLLDRTLFLLGDNKCQGQWSANKLRESGPSPTYRVQKHVYAYGMRLKGERVDYVAIISWPRDKSSLDDLHVHIERYDPSIALDALARVDDIAQQVDAYRSARQIELSPPEVRELLPLEIAYRFPNDNSDCRFCPFHAPDDKLHERGCDGK